MNYTKSILFVLSFLFMMSCSKLTNKEETEIEIWPNGVIYEIFVRSFADSNGDGIGDINGMTSKLDYLQELGIKGIWLMPMSPSPSYHKYDVTDYYGIDPEYGTMDDFKHFLAEAHKRDIKVVIDFVINHSSENHPWFLEAMKDKSSQYRDYYVWANIDSVKEQLSKKVVTLDSDNITQWHKNIALKNAEEEDQDYYYGFFWKGMPDLNYDNPKVRAEMIKAGSFWLQEVGVDGLRLDAARHIFPDNEQEKAYAWWTEFGEAMRAVKPDVYLVGEVWGSNSEIAPYVKGLHSMFNFPLYFAIHDLMLNEQDNGIIDTLINTRALYAKASPQFTDAILVNNHDRNRLISEVEGSIEKHKQAFAILLTLPGTPYVYYGDEIGMLGEKPDEMIREPFLWDKLEQDSVRTTWIKPENSNDSTVMPLAMQEDNPSSTYHFFKAWINQRNKLNVLREGTLTSLKIAPNVLAYSSENERERLVVLYNLSDKNVKLPLSKLNCSKIVFNMPPIPHIVKDSIELSAYQSVILK
jgi:alpha-amylase